MTIEQARKCAKKALSPRRYRHTKNVAAAARALALRWGQPPDEAELAGWLHDIVKERSRDDLLQMMAQGGIMAQSIQKRPLPVWHGPVAAIYAQRQLGVENPAVLSAIACHTTGKEDMSVMDKVLFLADVISEERTYQGVEEIRRLAYEDLDAAVIAAMEENLAYLNSKGKALDEDTVRALDYLIAQRDEPPGGNTQ